MEQRDEDTIIADGVEVQKKPKTPIIPPQPEQGFELDNPGRSGGKSSRSGLTVIAIAVLLSVVVNYFIGSSQMVSKKDFTLNVGGMATTVNNMKATVDSNASSLGAALTGIPNQINAGINTAIGQFNTSLSQLTTQVQADKTAVADIKKQVDALSTQITNGLPGNTQIQSQLTKIDQSITALTQRLDGDKVRLDDLAAKVLALTPSTGTGTTTTAVTATVLGNTFTGSTSLLFAPITTSASQSISFSVANNTGKTLNNIQFAIGLQLLDSMGNPLTTGLPAGTTVALSSTGVLWNAQSTGYNYILGFTNTTPTGIFGGIGAISQASGTATYNVSVTITGTTTSQIVIYPIVKVVSFS